MGGYGSGQWRTARYATVEDCCVFDVAWLKQRGALCPGSFTTGTASWTRGEEPAGSIGWAADVLYHSRDSPSVQLCYGAGAEDVDERVALLHTRPPYGGVRWWFGCPRCGRRSAKLYLPRGATRFRCRRCYRLAYQCQRETQADRLLRRGRKLWRRIGADTGTAPRMGQKPKWMRKRTYWRLREQANALDAVSFCLAIGRFLPHLVPRDFDPHRAARPTPQRPRRRRKRDRKP